MSEYQIAQLRQRIEELEKSDAEFARKANILLDHHIINEREIEQNAAAIERLTQSTAENTRDIDRLAEHIGTLAQESAQSRQERDADMKLILKIVDDLSASVRIAVEQSQISQAQVQRIWEYLLSQSRNGHS